MAALLEEENREVQAFVELLRQEQAALVGGDQADALMALVERKAQFSIRLEALDARREQALTEQGHGKGRSGMEAWLAAVADPAVSARWQALLAQAAEARQLNETNGKLIAMHWQHNQAALATLMTAANRAMTYGPDGQQKGSGGGRSFGSA